MVKWSRIFVHSIRGLPNFLAIPIMNPLSRVHDENTAKYIRYCVLRYFDTMKLLIVAILILRYN